MNGDDFLKPMTSVQYGELARRTSEAAVVAGQNPVNAVNRSRFEALLALFEAEGKKIDYYYQLGLEGARA